MCYFSLERLYCYYSCSRVEIGVIVCLHGVAAPTLASDTDHVKILVKASQMYKEKKQKDEREGGGGFI